MGLITLHKKKFSSIMIGLLVIGGLFFSGSIFQLNSLILIYGGIVAYILLFLVNIAPKKIELLDFQLLNQEYKKKNITTRYFFSILNRKYFFPFLLMMYLIYLLIQQTKISGRDMEWRFIVLNQQVLLFLIILSGLFLVYKQDCDSLYQIEKSSIFITLGCILLSMFLGVITIIIIHKHVISLEIIGSIITLFSGVGVFLIGMLLMEEHSYDKV